jgi:RNA recognition motif-containing protein
MKNGTDEHSLRKMFIKFGDISSVTHRGTYAFVEFLDPEAAQNAIREMADKGEMRV